MGGLTLPGGIKSEEWDTFHSIIVNDELYRYTQRSCVLLKLETDSKTLLQSGLLWDIVGLGWGQQHWCTANNELWR
jgi:hypothetical protein